MNSFVIYGSRFGNTQKVAESIASALTQHGLVQLLVAEHAPAKLPPGTDLVVIGGPTEAHQLTPPLHELFERFDAHALEGVAAAAFDTRLPWPRFFSGSAAAGITRRLREAGAHLVAAPESFIVRGQVDVERRRGPSLDPGELLRAAEWADLLASRVEAEEEIGRVAA